ncbi:MAG: cation:proton antiporter [Pyrinomonadaceae bacterium]
MHTPVLFADLLIIFGVSVPVAFLCLRLKLPLLVGLMLTGILIGPYGLGLIKELESIEFLAEIGVMLLLFTIGLEFSLGRLREMKRLVLIGGGLQVGLTVAATAAVSVLFGRELKQGLFFGFLVALSSTAIVLKSYAERNETDAPHGRAGVGVLLFQDISIVLMMLLVPVLGGGEDASSAGAVAVSLGASILALVIIVAAAYFLIPVLLGRIVRLKSPEVFLLTVVFLGLGTAWITSQFGLSLALGAFIAGMVLADSDYSHQITAEILPFRDVFNSLFFVSIGLLLSVGSLIENAGAVLLLVISLMAGKALIIWGVVRVLGFPQRISAMTALGLAQIGEFSFVLAKAGKAVDLLPGTDYQTFLAASIISMIATPFLIAAAPRFGYFVQSFLSDGRNGKEEEAPEIHLTSSGGLENHVIIVGYGLNGRHLARVLRTVLVPYTVLDLNAEAVRGGKAKGEKINFGDSTRREVLKHAGIDRASALVLALSDPQAARRTVRNARDLSPEVYIIVRTRYISEIGELLALGADEVIAEEFETSIEIFSRVLQRYGAARRVIEEQTAKIRRQGYEMLRSPSAARQIRMANLNAALHAAATETVELDRDSPANGKKIRQTDLRKRTGVTIIAVIREGQTLVNPGAEYALIEGDTLVLLGESEKIRSAVKILKTEGEKV